MEIRVGRRGRCAWSRGGILRRLALLRGRVFHGLRSRHLDYLDEIIRLRDRGSRSRVKIDGQELSWGGGRQSTSVQAERSRALLLKLNPVRRFADFSLGWTIFWLG